MSEAPEWMETQGTVTACKYQFARMNTFTMGIQMQDKFRIGFDYYAHGRLYTDEYQSPVAVPQGTGIAVRYNPLAPGENDRSGAGDELGWRAGIFGLGGDCGVGGAFAGVADGAAGM